MNHHAPQPHLSPDSWYQTGEFRYFDPETCTLSQQSKPGQHRVFRRRTGSATRWASDPVTVFLGGFPDGSFGWSRVEPRLNDPERPRLYIDYLGMGASDTPRQYRYSSMERADQIEAHLLDLGIRDLHIVSFDFSSLAVMEILSRQADRQARGEPQGPRILSISVFNGGLFTDGHSHPWFTTPVLNSPFGGMGTWFAQRSRFVFAQMVDVLWSKDYGVTPQEVFELFSVVTRNRGAHFMSAGAGFVREHFRQKTRWDFKRLFVSTQNEIRWCLVASEKDPFERKQVRKAEKRLRAYAPDTRWLPGGHLTTSEHPDLMAEIIHDITDPTDS